MLGSLRLGRIGRVRYQQTKLPREHQHDFFQISYVIKGKGSVLLNGELYDVGTGDVHICHPRWTHDIWPCPNQELMTIDLRFAVTDSAQLERIIGMPPFVCDNDYGILRHLQAIELEAVLRQDPFWQDVAHTHLAQLIFEILRQQHKRENGHRPELQSALGIIHQSLPAGIDLEQLAHRVHLSSSHLITLFKTHLGKTPQRVQTELKIEHIKHELLTSPDTSITVIVRQYGWRDQRAFRRQFREYVGMTPTEFRERYPHHQETEQTSESWVVFSRSIPMAWKSVTRV